MINLDELRRTAEFAFNRINLILVIAEESFEKAWLTLIVLLLVEFIRRRVDARGSPKTLM